MLKIGLSVMVGAVCLLTNSTSGREGNDTLSSIENVTGTSRADSITGNGVSNTLRGVGGNDSLLGGGNDTMNGGTGTDTCNGGDGNADTANASCETVTNVP